MTEQPKNNKEKLVEKYSKRWGVSPEEAEKRIEQIMARKQNQVPGVENPFPEALGPVSQKAQDVNQAILSTQYTRRMLGAPQEDIALLNQKIQEVGEMVNSLAANFQAKIEAISSTLEGRQAQEERDALKRYLDEALAPVRQEISAIKEKVGKEGPTITPGAATDMKVVLENVEAATKNAEELLGFRGFKIEKESITKDDVSKMIDEAQKTALDRASPEEMRKRVESQGYKVVGGPITFDQAQAMVLEAYRKGADESMGQKQVEAVTNLINNSVKSILDMFKPGMQAYMEGMFTKGQPSNSGGQPSNPQQPEPSSTGPGSQ